MYSSRGLKILLNLKTQKYYNLKFVSTMSIKRKFNKKKNKNVQKTRKELRKEKRKLKKVKKQEYYMKRHNKKLESKTIEHADKKEKPEKPKVFKEPKDTKKRSVLKDSSVDKLKKEHDKEEMDKKKLEKQMQKQRSKQLLEANDHEDKLIKKLEKQLKLNKLKSKIPKSFTEDGLDYILEICDPEVRKTAAQTEKSFNKNESEDEFDEDFAVATGKHKSFEKEKNESDDEIDEDETFSDQDQDSNMNSSDGEENSNLEEDDEDDSENVLISPTKKSKNKTNSKKFKLGDSISDKDSNQETWSSDDDDNDDDDNDGDDDDDGDQTKNSSSEWEDIYGRKRDAKGNIIESSQTKYIPPALRSKITDKDSAEIQKLKRQMKGLLNRLTEANLISISQQFENLYTSGNYSRHNLNSTFCELINSAIISYALTPKRTVADHALLIAVLHANIDIEIGANYLQNTIEKYDQLVNAKESAIENKELENCVHIVSQLYNLKMFHCGLVHEILKNLLDNGLTERNVESCLLMLKTVGPVLRKDDPASLKQTLLYIQDIIANAPDSVKISSRLKFMSDILMAIKNNNFSKIPNYSPDDIEHLRKVLRSSLRKGNYVTQLNIGLDDLLNAEKRGKWWVVGSAWFGKSNSNQKEQKEEIIQENVGYSEQLLELARKQRMNTDIRRNIFCILMTAEDYLDAFEKLLHLGLRGQQEREIIYVLMHCCLQEKTFNPYYAILAQKFCDYDRKYKIAIQCSVWDKLKDLKNFKSTKIINLAKFLTFLFIQGGLPLSVLKVVELSDLDKPLLRLLRQTILGVLLNDDLEAVTRVWERAGGNPTFKQGLRLFIHHFILRGNAVQSLSEKDQQLIRERVKIAEKMLSSKDKRIAF